MAKLAFVFPGQGSQYVGMGQKLVQEFPEARMAMQEASEACGLDLLRLCLEGPAEELRRTANCQPAVLAVSAATLRVVQERTPVRPQLVAGHSLGEYTALVAADAVGLAEAARLVRLRGSLMEQAYPSGGGMAAILGLSRQDVEEICREAAREAVLVPANYNCPGQVVISGQLEAIERAMQLARQRGGKAVALQVSGPFHTPFMSPAAEGLRQALERVAFRDPRVPVVSNVEAKPNTSGQRAKELLVKQLTHPVRWEESVREMLRSGVEGFVEVGPGRVLCGLIRRIDRRVRLANVEDPQGIRALEGWA